MTKHLHNDPARLAHIRAARKRVYDNERLKRLRREANPKPMRVSRGEHWRRKLDWIDAMAANQGYTVK